MECILGTQKGACGECYKASARFLDFLMHKGVIKAGDSYGVSKVEFWANPPFSGMGHAHYVARVDKTYFDWTLRQYDYRAVFPYIFAP